MTMVVAQFTFEILVANSLVVILPAVIAERKTFQIFSVRADFC